MTPEKKAKQLYNKMEFETKYNSQPSTVHGMCKKLALVCVDEVLDAVTTIADRKFEFYTEVKQEINKL